MDTVMNTEVEWLEACEVCGGRNLLAFSGEADLVRCGGCGYVFHNPRPVPEAVAHFYATPGKYASWLDEERGREHLWRSRLRIVRRRRRAGRLLDIGAGVGAFLNLARESFDVSGTEVSTEAILVAKERYDIELLAGAVEEMELPPGSFDVITMFHVLEHLHRPAETLAECRRLLKPGGLLIVAVPNELKGLKFRLKRLAARFGLSGGARWFGEIDLNTRATDEVHLSHFTAGVMRRLLHGCGFRAVRDTLDRHYVSTGLRRPADDLFFAACWAARHALGLRIYDTLLVTAERPS